MRILVTGGAGFIGSHVVDAFVGAGHRVAVVDNLSTGSRTWLNPTARLHVMDVRSARLGEVFEAERPEAVAHLAAQAAVSRSVADPVFDASVNIQGGLNLLDCCRRFGVGRVIYSSSGGAGYGDTDRIPTPEDHPTLPMSPYGVSKVAFELYLDAWRGLFGTRGISLRYANVYGPRQSPEGEAGVVAIFSEAMLGARPLKINGDGEQTRDYVYVGDLVEAAARAARSEKAGVWNLGTGVETSVNRLFALLAREYGYTADPPHVPAPAGEQKRSVLDGSLVRRDFDLPAWTRLEDGLKKTAEFFRSRHRA